MRHAGTSPRPARGVASLALVLVMFFAVTLLVVYANRALIFEQRTSANQFRATLAFEAAESGIEWTIAMLNRAGRIDTACQPSTVPGTSSFRERMLAIDTGSGAIAPTGRRAACRADTGNVWTCDCPDAGAPTLPAAAGTGYLPAIGIEFAPVAQGGATRIVATGCTNLGADCVPGAPGSADGVARVEAVVALASALPHPPSAAITALGDITLEDSIGVSNTDPNGPGLTVDAGGSVTLDPTVRVVSRPGTPAPTTLARNDAAFRDASNNPINGDAMFASFFGMSKQTFRELPGVSTVSCGGGACNAATVQAATAGGDVQLLWIDGNVDINANLAIGALDRPVLMVVDGSMRLRGGATIYGLIYSTAATWDNGHSSNALLRGAAIVEGDFTGGGSPQFFYDAYVLDQLATRTGAFTRVPGGWRDFSN